MHMIGGLVDHSYFPHFMHMGGGLVLKKNQSQEETHPVAKSNASTHISSSSLPSRAADRITMPRSVVQRTDTHSKFVMISTPSDVSSSAKIDAASVSSRGKICEPLTSSWTDEPNKAND